MIVSGQSRFKMDGPKDGAPQRVTTFNEGGWTTMNRVDFPSPFASFIDFSRFICCKQRFSTTYGSQGCGQRWGGLGTSQPHRTMLGSEEFLIFVLNFIKPLFSLWFSMVLIGFRLSWKRDIVLNMLPTSSLVDDGKAAA